MVQLQRLSERLHELALRAATDEAVVSFFDINSQYFDAVQKGPVPAILTEKVSELRARFNRHYIESYFAFHNLLFVDMGGTVFYTIRKESDVNGSLLAGELATSPLAQCIGKTPTTEVFIDFQEYGPSAEPAAFFVEPIHKSGTQIGWIVLQCAINKVNSLFAWTDELGESGETFLVNQHGFMLTESRFTGSSTILKKQLDNRNIQAKFKEKQGHRTVTDYRGHTALTSFEVFHFLETRWLVVAKVDRDEVVTGHYIQHRRYYGDRLLATLKAVPLPPLREPALPAAPKILRVDMDEFLKAESGERLETFGVSTCTALVVAYPGKSGYLAHISPRDRVYGGEDTNLLDQMIKRISAFDVYPSQRRHILFIVVATHFDSLLNVVDRIADEGFLLSQIRVLIYPQARSASLAYDYSGSHLSVAWRMDGGEYTERVHHLGDAFDVGEVIQQTMDSEQEATTRDGECQQER